jgi:hypothetical protein
MVNLDQATIDKLRGYDSTMKVLAAEIDRADRAGIDVTELKDQFMTLETLRQGLLKEYAPPPRARKVAVGVPRKTDRA